MHRACFHAVSIEAVRLRDVRVPFRDGTLAGAHYGLAFLLLKRGDAEGATQHLKAFLGNPPRGVDAQKWIGHAEEALRGLEGGLAPRQSVGLEGA